MKKLIVVIAVIVICTAVAFGYDSTVIMGYWEIPDLGTISPLYRQNLDTRDAQLIVDRPNSAYYGDYGLAHMICDHANSWVGGGYWNMSKIKLDSRAYLILPDRTEEYICYMVCRADYGELINTINGKGVYPFSETDIICACCATMDASEDYMAFYRFNRVTS